MLLCCIAGVLTNHEIIRTITLTRKLFTMLLSVVVYNHQLTSGQWLGAAVVFAGISVEAFVKRQGSLHLPRCIDVSLSLLRRCQRQTSRARTRKGQNQIFITLDFIFCLVIDLQTCALGEALWT